MRPRPQQYFKMVNINAVTAGVAVLVTLLGDSLANPGETHTAEKRKRDLAQNQVAVQHAKRAAAECSGSAGAQQLAKRAAMRRAAKAQELREKRGLEYCKILDIEITHARKASPNAQLIRQRSRHEDQARPGGARQVDEDLSPQR